MVVILNMEYKNRKEYMRMYTKEYYVKHAERIKSLSKIYREKHKKKIAKREKEYRELNKEHVLKQKKEYREKNKGIIRIRQKKCTDVYRSRLKSEVLFHYSKGKMECNCCGEKETDFLNIDHADDNGSEHRKKVGAGDRTYKWLKENGHPSGFRVLCFNCNIARSFPRNKGVCPHKKVK